MSTSVHSLNILKGIFNDNSLKSISEPYVHRGFERSILGFS